ncbi:MAG: hypothetical protein ABIB71_06895 [Candidatus Woesearchaeota archaeon]
MVALHLNKKVDDFLSGYSKLEVPDERIEHKVEGSLLFERFEELRKQYEEILAESPLDYHQQGCSRITATLRPQQINSFLQATIKYGSHKNYSARTGNLITRLIQNSHDAGNNKFTLNTKALSKDIHNIGYKLRGKEGSLLEIIVVGNVGWACASNAKNIGQICISGNVGNHCSNGAKNIKGIYIGGNAGAWCGTGAKNSTFKTPNLKTLRLLKWYVPNDKNNKIYFIKANSKEKRIWRLIEILNYRLW